jgi:hypothetical protein
MSAVQIAGQYIYIYKRRGKNVPKNQKREKKSSQIEAIGFTGCLGFGWKEKRGEEARAWTTEEDGVGGLWDQCPFCFSSSASSNIAT